MTGDDCVCGHDVVDHEDGVCLVDGCLCGAPDEVTW